ncbi:DNA recombination protein RmuC [Neoehrlichia mikurensis]|uniref:DNA recombination protein RmuC homolog n=1 Tax=Neoehrlichia mikurensis TaxID=89586 RepID=A0A9Q9BYY2_9RICK|nr:DNA recombination protein RmuC [Neoehrlichia mikurensis]QXK92005.1 DNA recombination protein RmuC [Neoehrlichia mikurensis]QXK92462.1 DNA recombination protein RmuC [Neoehrlichia mikurensis]QXK93698.1 DNA recombination protein RmuC [Neoehrlichia mikurensis]UTO55329.1 DNA recombination protein RmuC [Neoehrlichia mikurensis]UTO56250.1 DNA recombination protein RmuC [Neoehrlichia mikurensis]
MNIIVALLIEGILIAIIAYFIALRTRISKIDYEILNTNKKLIDEKLKKIEDENESLKKELWDISNKYTVTEVEKKNLENNFNLYKVDFMQKIDEKYRLYFENLANRIFDEKTDKFNKISQESLNSIINPLRDSIQTFKQKIETTFIDHNKDQFLLRNEIQRIVLANEKITLQAENLANALKGEVKIQGNWGEVILEKMLEDSGLRKDQDYKLQSSGMNFTGEEGNKQYPDVVILLPENKHIIVDSKVSLTHYERYCAEKIEMSKIMHLKQFTTSLRCHINTLAEKKYQNIDNCNAPDFVLMFIPIEGAYFLAIQKDMLLHEYSWNKKIVIVCPSTLFATLKTIESVWRLERQNRNTMEIARQGGALYDKIVGFVTDMQKLGKQIDIVSSIYSDTMKKLSEGHGNILSRTQNLKHLGVKTSKKLECVE